MAYVCLREVLSFVILNRDENEESPLKKKVEYEFEEERTMKVYTRTPLKK